MNRLGLGIRLVSSLDDSPCLTFIIGYPTSIPHASPISLLKTTRTTCLLISNIPNIIGGGGNSLEQMDMLMGDLEVPGKPLVLTVASCSSYVLLLVRPHSSKGLLILIKYSSF